MLSVEFADLNKQVVGFSGILIVSNTEEVTAEGCQYKKQDSTHRPSALTGIGGGSLDFVLRFRVVAVQ